MKGPPSLRDDFRATARVVVFLGALLAAALLLFQLFGPVLIAAYELLS